MPDISPPILVSAHAAHNFGRRVRPAGEAEVRECVRASVAASPRLRRLIWRCVHWLRWQTTAAVPPYEASLHFLVNWQDGAAFMADRRPHGLVVITAYSFRELRKAERPRRVLAGAF